MNFNFGEILTRAWQIIWKHKILWVFGILASCSRGGGSGSSGASSSGNSGFSSGQPIPFDQGMEQFNQWMNENLALFVGAVILVLVLVLLFAFLGTIGRIGLIKGTYKAERGTEQLVLGELFSESIPYFWRVFGLSFLIGLAFLLIFIPILLFGVFTAGIGFACLLPLLCLLIPVGLVVNIVIEQANAAIVLEELTMLDGLRRGWEIVKSNIVAVLIMAIILAVIGGVIGLVVAIPLLLAVIPAALAFAIGEAQNWAPLMLAGVCVCLYLPIVITVQGIIVAYIESAWTLTYLQLTGKPGKPESGVPITPESGPPPLEQLEDSDKTLIARANA
jgi:hypothetical protein